MSIKLTVPRSNLVAAAAVSAVLAALACISTASAQTTPGQPTTIPQDSKNDMARCSQLFSARSRYHANGSNYSAQDTEAELALEQCKAGRVDAGVASLESLLRQNRIPVPPAETARAR